MEQGIGTKLILPYKDQIPPWPGGSCLGGVEKSRIESYRKVRVQTLGRPPTQRQVEEWLRVKQVINKEKEEEEGQEGKDIPVLDQTQLVKLRVRQNSDDSWGTELSLSLPSLGSDNESDEKESKKQCSENKDKTISSRQRTKSCDSECDILETSQSFEFKGRSDDSGDASHVCDHEDNDDDIAFPPSPTRSIRSSHAKRRLSWDKTANIEARLADSPGFREKFASPENKRHKSQIEAVSPTTPATLMDLGSANVGENFLLFECNENKGYLTHLTHFLKFAFQSWVNFLPNAFLTKILTPPNVKNVF